MLPDRLPTPATPFIGRIQELRDIAALLADPACRLLTLLGPGGIGKTRLALEAARQWSSPDGVYFVPLQSLMSADLIITAIADALSLQLYSRSEPQQQLLDYLRDKALLLVLDNFEHLLVGAPWLSDVLSAAPAVKLLITSRERLNLIEAWGLEVQGLHCPPSDIDTNLDTYDAIQLFVQHARRVQSGFMLTDSRKPAVSRICRLVGGMPLGIELAAAWVRVLSCSQIADEIGRSLEILETLALNMPSRHRTMRAAFTPTWQRLTEFERDVFMKLSVFRGGFTLAAATRVSGASVVVLLSLADKSLLRLDANDRYDLHELLRQYGEEQLSRRGDFVHMRDAHSAFYADFCSSLEPDIKGLRQLEALNKIEADFENVRTAWVWAIEIGNQDLIARALESLYLYCEIRSRFHEVEDLLRQAEERFAPADGETPPQVWGRLLARLSFDWQQDVERRLESREQALAIAQYYENPAEIGYCFWRLGEVCSEKRNYADALPFLERSLAQYQEIEDRFYIGKVLNEFGISYRQMRQLETALRFQQQGLAVRRAIHDYRGVGWCLYDMSITLYLMGHATEAATSLGRSPRSVAQPE